MNEIAGRAPRDPAQPSPYIDRRALSQAWYSALFDARHAPGGNSGVAPSGAVKAEGTDAAPQPAHVRSLSAIAAKAPPDRTVRFRVLRAAFATDGRARAPKAPAENALRAAVRRAVWRRTFARTTLPAGHAVDLLVQQRGDLLRLIAIYDGRDAGRVKASLLRARAALVERGLRVELDARQKGTS